VATLQRYLGRLTLPTSATSFSVGGNPVTLTSARYYMTGYTGEVTAQLLEHIQAQIRALGAPYGSTTVVMDPGTGHVTIDALGGATTIVWSHTDLRDLLGFDATLTGADTYTAAFKARYCWFPSRPLSDYPGDLTQWWTPRSTSYPYRSPGGTTYGVQGTIVNDGKFKYSHLTKAEVITSSDTVHETFQKFWTDVIHTCEPFRVFPDATLNTSTDFKTAILGTLDDEAIGSFADYRDRHIRTYNGLWTVEMYLWEYLT